MSAHVILNLVNKLGKSDRMRALCRLFVASLRDAIIQEHEC